MKNETISAASIAANKNQAQANSADDPTTRSAAPEVRGDLASQDAQRTHDDGLISDAEFSRILNEDFDQTALPKPPAMPGWHLCWLTTTSAYDTIQKRQRLGYTPVRPTEVPGFDPSNSQTSATPGDGFVRCNEMILFKIREERYQQMMTHFHHKQPLHEESDIVERVKQQVEEHTQRSGKPVQLGSGFTEMEESVRRGEKAVPTFSST